MSSRDHDLTGLPADVLGELARLPRHRFEHDALRCWHYCAAPELVRLTGNPAVSLRPADECQGCGLVITDEELVRVLGAGIFGASDLELNLVVLLRGRR